MKRLMAIGLLSVLLVVFCGAPEEGPGTETKLPEEKGVAEIAYQTLTEAELQKFMKVFPVAKEIIEKSGKEFKGDVENWEGWTGQFSTADKEIAGLDVKLRAAGMPWDEFWPVFGKVMTASVANMFDAEMGKMDKNFKEMEAQLNDPKIPEAQKEMMKQAMSQMQDVKKMYGKVPQANKALVKKHWDEISKLLEIEN